MEFVIKLIAVAIGGASGAVVRYLINISPVANLFAKFPFPTFLINITGSFLIGFLLVLLTDKIDVNDNLRMAIIVGFLGALTTFSTFEMEIFGLVREREFTTAFVYMSLSVVVGFVGVVGGATLARRF
ncbi:MAG TPA: fluoride efflux transporter CrcB [Pyrinomonadaceae bacterium]|nr:fluoride efflux transporter CrcB [Chloracidobacterium sp.]MBP9934143.1 fluoride efflux transporter CrcB [Pyrinomonadaceae bacterium]MBK7801659.1 fluoride efflux transporter CrcB [Chloracidobacterium sp.]MBK9436974.1 fluoride efflux transporter CrcB [Chloracidobacterium sp.]MBK9768164.1 fluoride efflux transporter CrcB [Chloracidobacterium sp.]